MQLIKILKKNLKSKRLPKFKERGDLDMKTQQEKEASSLLILSEIILRFKLFKRRELEEISSNSKLGTADNAKQQRNNTQRSSTLLSFACFSISVRQPKQISELYKNDRTVTLYGSQIFSDTWRGCPMIACHVAVLTAYYVQVADNDWYEVAEVAGRLANKGVTRVHGDEQESRSWNKRFDIEIKKIGFTQNLDEPCVYLKASGSSVAFLILYVDDILLMGNNVTMLQEVKSWLSKCFSMKDLGKAAYILGIKIIRDRSKQLINLSQSAYLKKILKRFRMENSKKGNTKDMVLVFGAKPEAGLKVSCYADASFQTDKDDTKSQTGYVFVLNGGAVDWKSAKQSTTAISSIEAEYIAATEA
ncbi:retrotransposon protein, putative, ty1-copia subclass [Tanacetum coccineum]|uniref:Retrotransposon protein, putative, ty1-copia subclass n=1 Tax=Tanacetum coccineum TaxID=301880 RepID=A0ABQ5HZ94_9ASTR